MSRQGEGDGRGGERAQEMIEILIEAMRGLWEECMMDGRRRLGPWGVSLQREGCYGTSVFTLQDNTRGNTHKTPERTHASPMTGGSRHCDQKQPLADHGRLSRGTATADYVVLGYCGPATIVDGVTDLEQAMPD